MAYDRNEIKALIDLLEDPSEEVFLSVSERLIGSGAPIIPELETAWERSPEPLMQNRLENLIQKIQFNYLKELLDGWIRSGNSDLLTGAYLVARFQYPDLSIKEKVLDPIESIRNDLWLEINNNLTALEKINLLNRIFFEVHKFGKSDKDFYNPRNSYINQVLERKKGNPITLAIIYAVVAQQVGMPVYGVNLPKNFILAYIDEYSASVIQTEDQNDVLFYINPYNEGAVFSRKEIKFFLKEQKIPSSPKYYKPCSNTEIVFRMIMNLILAYEQLGESGKIAQLKEMLSLFTKGDQSS